MTEKRVDIEIVPHDDADGNPVTMLEVEMDGHAGVQMFVGREYGVAAGLGKVLVESKPPRAKYVGGSATKAPAKASG